MQRHDFARHRSFQAHVKGRGFDWATAVFSTSAIHQGSTSRLLGPFQLSIPSKQILSWLKTASDPQLCCAYNDKRNVGFESPRHSGCSDEGVTPRLLHVRIPD